MYADNGKQNRLYDTQLKGTTSSDKLYNKLIRCMLNEIRDTGHMKYTASGQEVHVMICSVFKQNKMDDPL